MPRSPARVSIGSSGTWRIIRKAGRVMPTKVGMTRLRRIRINRSRAHRGRVNGRRLGHRSTADMGWSVHFALQRGPAKTSDEEGAGPTKCGDRPLRSRLTAPPDASRAFDPVERVRGLSLAPRRRRDRAPAAAGKGPQGAADALTEMLSNFASMKPSVLGPEKQLAMFVRVPIWRRERNGANESPTV